VLPDVYLVKTLGLVTFGVRLAGVCAARFTRRGRLVRLTVGHRAIARHLHKTTLTLLLAVASSPSSVPARCSTANASGNPRSASLREYARHSHINDR